MPRSLIVMSGLAGSGKSSIAEAIGRSRGIPVLSVDPIELAIVAAGIGRTFDTGLAAYLVAAELADRHLAAGLDVVIDAANYVEPGRNIWRELARRRGAALRILVCEISDADVHLHRLVLRNRGLAIDEPTPADVAAQQAEWTDWPEAHLVLDATDKLQQNVAKALAYLNREPHEAVP